MFHHKIYWAKGVGLSLSKYCKIDIFVNNRLIKTRTFEFMVTVHFGLWKKSTQKIMPFGKSLSFNSSRLAKMKKYIPHMPLP